ncbi:MAG: pimeloyl-ACP methyl ester carboxylesterase [Phycisphaerales bacterium]|jgi:pimeloyl-ACP methyl ester carboxylesterase
MLIRRALIRTSRRGSRSNSGQGSRSLSGFVETEKTSKLARTRKFLARAVIAGMSAVAVAVIGSLIMMPADNPAFDSSSREIKRDLARMEADPVGLARPVIVLSGYRGHSGAARDLAAKIRELTGASEEEVITLSYMFDGTIEEPARKLVALVEEHFPSRDGRWTAEVDIVAISMGGLVARLAAADPVLRDEPADGDAREARRLNIHAIYTLATPHRGASLADRVSVDAASEAMAPGSAFLEMLDEQLESASYTIVPYAVLRDRWVGAERTAPWGQDPIWVAGRMARSHHMVSKDARIQADLARRLRDEKPLASPSKPPQS